MRKQKSKGEYRLIPRASWQHLESVSDGNNIAKLCRMMLSEGVGGPVEIYRHNTPVFLSGTVEEWATGGPGKGEQPEQLKRKHTNEED